MIFIANSLSEKCQKQIHKFLIMRFLPRIEIWLIDLTKMIPDDI